MKPALACCAIAVSLAAPLAQAGPEAIVVSTYLDELKHRIDLKFGTVRPGGEERESALTPGVGMELTPFWFSELYATWEHGGEGTAYEAAAWVNAFQLTHGQFPVDIGLYTEIERPRDRAEGYEVTFGPLFQTDFGRTQVNFNALFQRHYRAEEAGAMQLNYQWQVKHRWTHAVQFGLQGFGELGKWNDWAPHKEQSHRFGPAIFGVIETRNKQKWTYDAALLFRAAGVHTGPTFRAQLVFGF